MTKVLLIGGPCDGEWVENNPNGLPYFDVVNRSQPLPSVWDERVLMAEPLAMPEIHRYNRQSIKCQGKSGPFDLVPRVYLSESLGNEDMWLQLIYNYRPSK
jgi:hypothetical protein